MHIYGYSHIVSLRKKLFNYIQQREIIYIYIESKIYIHAMYNFCV